MSIRTIIIEDELHNLEHLERLIRLEVPALRVIATARSVAEAHKMIHQYQPELLLLDIQLKGETGFDLLSGLTDIRFEIIFITAYDQYGIQAVKFSALDYLLKPVMALDLQQAVGKAISRIEKKQQDRKLENLLAFLSAGNHDQQKLALPLQDEVRYEPVMSIIRLEASNNYCYIFLENGERLLVCKTLKEFAGMLEPYNFIRTHQSHLVNMKTIKSYLKEDGGMLLLVDQSKIPISKAHRSSVKEKLQRFSRF